MCFPMCYLFVCVPAHLFVMKQPRLCECINCIFYVSCLNCIAISSLGSYSCIWISKAEFYTKFWGLVSRA